MPIINVIDILRKGAGSHFEPRLVDKFLAIPVNKIVGVFLSESHGKISKEHDAILSHYNLLDIQKFGTDENATKEEKEVFDLFNFYYIGQTAETKAGTQC